MITTIITEADRANALVLARLFGGNGLSELQQLELAAAKIADLRAEAAAAVVARRAPSNPREAGRAAYFEGLSPLNNPHDPARTAAAHEEWVLGYQSAEREAS